MKYIESPSNDAFFNMAMEEYAFESLPAGEECFILWQNKNAIVVGKYQNTMEEINPQFVKENGCQVVRRLSGGGAMYQDMGNLNFTFIVPQNDNNLLDFEVFIKPVIAVLQEIGAGAEFNSRNDIVIDGKKISGNSQYNKKGKTMHHGTMLFDSNLDVVATALNVKIDKIESKGIKSVRSRVTNILEHLENKISITEFKQLLVEKMFAGDNSLYQYHFTDQDIEAIEKLKAEKYSTWEWVYGGSPKYNIKKENRFAFGKVELFLEVEQGTIKNIEISGDFFGNGQISELTQLLKETRLDEENVKEKLAKTDISYYIHGMETEQLAELILN